VPVPACMSPRTATRHEYRRVARIDVVLGPKRTTNHVCLVAKCSAWTEGCPVKMGVRGGGSRLVLCSEVESPSTAQPPSAPTGRFNKQLNYPSKVPLDFVISYALIY